MILKDLINEVYNGKVVLPDFQRSFIWEPEDIRELLVSILGDYFIGSMLILEKYKEDSPFALRLIEGVKEVNKSAEIQSIVKILLDGQQRTTALFYALYEPQIPLRNRKSPFKFYLDLDKALKKEWDKAVIAVSISDKRKLSEIKNNNNIIPFSLIKDVGELAQKFKDNSDLRRIIELANDFMNREIHIVSLSRDTDLEKIVETFERINRTGEPLSIFELLTARLYKYNIKLRDLLESTKEKYNFAEALPPEFILKVIALIRNKEPKRKNILELEPDNFIEHWENACEALQLAYQRITDIKNGYGVLDFKKWMPYTTMIVPLAAMINFIKAEKLETKISYEKVDKWYWSSVFLNRYDQAVDGTSYNDFTSIQQWIKDDKVPDFIQKFDVNMIDLDVDKQSSAIYRGVISLIVLEGALDFKTGQPPQFDKEKIQDDHIFPKSIYRNDTILNRTLITTNTEKSNKKPSEYFAYIIKIHGEEKLKEILKTHLIPEDALTDLLNDDLKNFIEKRKNAIIGKLKEKIMSK